MVEIWKDIKNYEGLYQISNTGKVKSLERILIRNKPNNQVSYFKLKEKILKPCLEGGGYFYVVLFDINKNRKNKKIHRLVAETFLDNDDIINKTQVNHIDGNKFNNNLSNLEWCTPIENTHHAMRLGLIDYSSQRFNKDYCSKKVYCIEDDKYFKSTAEASKYYDRSATNVAKACRTGCTCAGFHFEYVKEDNNGRK